VKAREKKAYEKSDPHGSSADGKKKKYWQRLDWKTGDLIPKDYNYLKAQFRVNEMSRFNGDERYIYLCEIRFKPDTCEFTPWFQHFLKVRRKWRKEPRIWRTIPWQEIELHKYPNDCWTLIKGTPEVGHGWTGRAKERSEVQIDLLIPSLITRWPLTASFVNSFRFMNRVWKTITDF